MGALDVATDRQLLATVIRNPNRIGEMTAHELSLLIDAAADARLLGWFLSRHESVPPGNVPEWLADRIRDVRATVTEAERAIRWEINRLQHAFADTDVLWVLLKGAGYVAAGLPPGRGRQVADIDLLVPETQLADAEATLKTHGWLTASLEPYDELYYRRWTHELPPMFHEERGSIVDVHHGILPRTSRLRPLPSRLLERSVPAGRYRVLCPSHMVLHAAAHLFHDGEVTGAIRDLVDITQLLAAFGDDPGFWDDWLAEAGTLGLQRPAYYAVRYAVKSGNVRVPANAVAHMQAWAPPSAVLRLMDMLVSRTISGRTGAWGSAATFALYVRSHWLRMPPLLLARHLVHKALARPKK